MMNFTRCLNEGGIVAYTRPERCDCVVAFAPAPGAATPEVLEAVALFDRWNGAAIQGGMRKRAILFFPEIDSATALTEAAGFVRHVVAHGGWGAFLYFNSSDPGGGAAPVPDGGTDFVVLMNQFAVQVTRDGIAQRPANLDALSFAWEEPKLRISMAGGKWRATMDVLAIYADRDDVFIDFDAHFPRAEDGSVPIVSAAGAWEGEMNAEILGELPIVIRYSRLVSDDQVNFRTERVLESRVFQGVLPGSRLGTLGLDPRDGIPTAEIQQYRSRIHFHPGALLETHLRSDLGLPVILRPAKTQARAIAPIAPNVIAGAANAGEWDVQSEGVEFYLEGDFEFAGVKGLPFDAAANDAEHRILTGAVATEFTRARIGDRMHFRGRRPGVLVVHNDVASAPMHDPGDDPGGEHPGAHNDETLHDGAGFVTTSWMTVTPAGGAGSFHTEPDNSPLFGKTPPAPGDALDDEAPAAFERKHLLYGQLSTASFMPVFPWAGRSKPAEVPQDPEAEPDAADEPTEPQLTAERFESTHLAFRRRTVVRPPRATPPPDPAPANAPAPPPALPPGVTPQGIYAELVDLDGSASFARLKFGNPDSSVPEAGEFEIKIAQTNTVAPVYQEIQRALRADRLFLVISRPTVEASATVEASSSMRMRRFEFKLDLTVETGKTILIVKYFRGKSLQELVGDPKLWGCKDHLAPAMDGAQILAKAQVTDGGQMSIPDRLKRVWKDENWQGVLALDLGVGEQPELFEALSPGMNVKDLRVHHAGLNFLPVKSTDLADAGQSRPGSAFGLVRYRKQSDPDAPMAVDTPPPETGNDQRGYSFTVETLDIEFVNSQIARFNTEVTTGFSHLFWDKPTGGGKLKLIGFYESRPVSGRPGETQDIFTLRTKNPEELKFENSWLDKFVVDRAEFNVLSSEPGTAGKKKIVSFIGLSGSLTFKKFPGLDLFGVDVKSVTVDRFGLRFTYDPGAERKFSCGFHADSVRAEIDFSRATNSLLAFLPVKLKGFRVAIDELIDLDKLGFVPISFDGLSPKFHFAFDLELDLGFLGKLSGVGKGLKLPMLLGWKSGQGGLGFGIQFPNWNGKSFEIGLQQFVAIRADRAQLVPCKNGDQVTAIAIALANARLVFFGKEWPTESKVDLALFVPASSGRKMSWALARRAEDQALRYLAAGHRIQAPSGSAAIEIIDSFKGILRGDETTNPCALVPAASAGEDGWIVLGEFIVQELVHVWFVLCDHPSLYALRLELQSVPGFSAEALYRQVNNDVGMFSAEVGLPDSLRTFQVGVATVRLPTFRVEVYTDGGFLVDLGFPWKNDYRRSFQLEIAIFLGSGGFYFGYTTAAAADILALENDDFGFHPPDRNVLGEFQAVRAGMAMRAGIGRSLDVGILKGEASLTVFCGLEGAVAYVKGSGNRDPVLFGIKGYMGIMLHIWAEVSFIVLRAKAELCVYVMVGFEIRRVLAQRTGGANAGHYYLTLPVTLFAEVGLYVHVEVWVTIGCVRVKLFDLEFRGTWHYEERIGGFSEALYRLNDPAPADAVLEDAPTLAAFAWNLNYRLFADGEPLRIFAAMLPCVADPADLSENPTQGDRFEPSVVVQPMLRVDDGFLKLTMFMVGWVLQADSEEDFPVRRSVVVTRRQELQDDLLWAGGTTRPSLPLENLAGQFAAEYRPVPQQAAAYAAMPLWPGSSWRFISAEDAPALEQQIPATMSVRKEGGGTAQIDGAQGFFIDYLRALTDATLAEVDRTIRAEWSDAKGPPDDAFLSWAEVWSRLNPPSPPPAPVPAPLPN